MIDNMDQKLTVQYENEPCYDIIFEQDYQGLALQLEKLHCLERKLCIVTDSNVGKLYANSITELVTPLAKEIHCFTFPAGEINKNLNTVRKLYEYLIQKSFDRNDILIALGGGVVGDLTGFAAATYLRGIRFIQLPTSLLAMVDSSIGGKTGVDFEAYKNMVGAFYMPKSVYINLASLHTLDYKEYNSGMGEIIKHGLIKDKSYYEWIKRNKAGIINKDYGTLFQLVYQSCVIKKNVVEDDPKEKGERALLNFGHTIGHAIEKLMGLKLFHGECVAIGMVAASYISMKRGMISLEEFMDIRKTLQEFSLPVTIENINPHEVIEVVKKDKKMDAGKIKFVLLEQVGKAYIDMTVRDEEMLESINYLITSFNRK